MSATLAQAAAALAAEKRSTLRLADYLLAGVPGTEGILGVGNGTRVRTFRSKKFIEFVLNPKTKRKYGLEAVKTEEDAIALGDRLLAYTPALFLPCERLKEKMSGMHVLKPLDPKANPAARRFDKSEHGRYFWVYQGNQTWNKVKLAREWGYSLYTTLARFSYIVSWGCHGV